MGRDQLDNYLKSKYPNNYIAGNERCSLLIWGVPSNGGILPKLCTLSVGVDFDPHNAKEEDIREGFKKEWDNPDSPIKVLFDYGKQVANGSNIEFGLIVFPMITESSKSDEEILCDEIVSFDGEIMSEEEIMSVEALLSDEEILFLTLFSSDEKKLKKAVIRTSIELKSKMKEILGLQTEQEGTTKEKNKSTADFFHDWSRCNLPASLVKVDVDGLLVDSCGSRKKIMIEIKRSNRPPIPKWQPYDEDLPGLFLLNSVAKATGSKMWILHHTGLSDCKEDTTVSLFIVEDVSDNKITYSDEYREIKLGYVPSVDSFVKTSLRI